MTCVTLMDAPRQVIAADAMLLLARGEGSLPASSRATTIPTAPAGFFNGDNSCGANGAAPADLAVTVTDPAGRVVAAFAHARPLSLAKLRMHVFMMTHVPLNQQHFLTTTGQQLTTAVLDALPSSVPTLHLILLKAAPGLHNHVNCCSLCGEASRKPYDRCGGIVCISCPAPPEAEALQAFINSAKLSKRDVMQALHDALRAGVSIEDLRKTDTGENFVNQFGFEWHQTIGHYSN